MTVLEWSSLLGNVGEFIGAIAVVVTLIYLAIQIRHSRKLLDENRTLLLSQTYRARTEMRMARDQLSIDPKTLATAELKMMNGESMAPEERLTLRSSMSIDVMLQDFNEYQEELGLLDSTYHERGAGGDARRGYIVSRVPEWDAWGIRVTPRLREVYETHRDAFEIRPRRDTDSVEALSDATLAERHAGRYRSGKDECLDFSARDGKLELVWPDNDVETFLPITRDRFVSEHRTNVELDFPSRERLSFRIGHRRFEYRRLEGEGGDTSTPQI